jgi:xanthine dehydrogenase accessory factor
VRNVFAIAARWLEENRSFALGTLVALRDAATAPIGTTVAVDALGNIFGNIGAGCHESAIVDACTATARDGRTRKLNIDLTIDDQVTGDAGCGAAMEVFVWRPQPGFLEVAREIVAGERAAQLIVEEFQHTFPAKDTLILVGATALAAEVAAIARRLDFNVTVVDPRPAFATAQRTPDAEIVRAWPDDYLPHALSEHTPIVMLSHDPKFDLAALRCALESNAPYIGLLGSRRSQSARRASLRDMGFDQGALERIHGPAGLQLGGASVAETALSIVAEIVAARHGGDGTPLRSGRGAIHRQLERAAGGA